MTSTPPPPEQNHVCILEKQLCLSLNKNWAAIGFLSVKKALIALCSESNGEKPAFALDITMGVNDSGEDILLSAIPTSFEDWINLPVRENDLYVLTKNGAIRAPTVIVSAHYDKTPLKKPRLCSRAIWERDNGTCQYSGKQLPKSQLNIDHVIPRDRGGRDTWENMVLADKDINSRKSNRLNSEVGLKLIRPPKAPKALPVSALITEAKHPSWIPFLIK
jgi:5-methylcytosine-specific restriction endonuclease McrA